MDKDGVKRWAVCVWCQEEVEDGAEVSGAPDGVQDWMIDGDFGCVANPLTGEDGTGPHNNREDITRIYLEHQAVLEAIHWGQPR